MKECVLATCNFLCMALRQNYYYSIVISLLYFMKYDLILEKDLCVCARVSGHKITIFYSHAYKLVFF